MAVPSREENGASPGTDASIPRAIHIWSRPLLMDFLLGWAALVLMAFWFRPLTPVDETRAVSVAWEMWLRHDFLVPHLNGEPYSHKPPLLQWCIHLLWLMFGVSEWGARLVAPLFGLGNLFLASALARRLWSDEPTIEKMVPWLLLAMPFWAFWSSLTLYDMLLTFFAELGMLGVLKASQGKTRAGWWMTGAAIGGGIIAKGPVILLLILPTAMFAPWWLTSKPIGGWRPWYRGMTGAIAIGATLGLAWAIPAGLTGGEEYRHMIFWGQSAGRIANAFAHKRPFWWYLELLPLLTFPWFWWPPIWRSLRSRLNDWGQRFCLVQIVFVLGLFSFISGKQIHYLLPVLPALTLFIARAVHQHSLKIDHWSQLFIGILVALPGAAALLLPESNGASQNEVVQMMLHAPAAAKWALIVGGLTLSMWPIASPPVAIRVISLSMLAVLLTAHIGYQRFGRPLYDMQPFADRLAAVERFGAPLIHWGKYNGDFNFLGRLRKPIGEIDDLRQLKVWLQANPNGFVVMERKIALAGPNEGADFVQPYRGSRRVMLWKANTLLAKIAAEPAWLN